MKNVYVNGASDREIILAVFDNDANQFENITIEKSELIKILNWLEEDKDEEEE